MMKQNRKTIDGIKAIYTSTNEKACYFWNCYERSDTTTVLQAYRTKPSQAKENAERAILQEMCENGGTGYRILSHSGFVFTCGYLRTVDDVQVLTVHTKSNKYIIINQ